jgi:hypothetical protein
MYKLINNNFINLIDIMSGRPSKQVLAEMLTEDNQGYIRTRTNDGSLPNSRSPAEESQDNMDKIFTILGTPLKKVQQAYLRDVVKTCYPDKHMAPDFTNAEQIALCKEQTHDKHFGSFLNHLENVRNSSQYRYQDCTIAAGNSLSKNMQCIRDYVRDTDVDNDVLKKKFDTDYAQFL